MRLDLCRTCGSETLEHSKCKICNQITRHFCPACNVVCIEQFHSLCEKTKTNNVIIEL